jgi:site-specific DNA-methyltransferase (adenine-specific)
MSQTVQRELVENHREPIVHAVHGSTAESMQELGDESVHLVVTSPPYWNIKDYGSDQQIGYDESLDTYLNRLNAVWEECYRVLKPGCRIVVNIGDQYHRSTEGMPYHITPLNAHIVNNILETTRHNLIFLGNIIWQKISNTETSGGASVMGSYGRPRNGYVSYDYEYISIFKKPGKAPTVADELKEADGISTEEWRELFNGHWNFTGDSQEEHPAPFPKELPQRVMRMFTFSGDRVLDPFLGRGTTMQVANELNRSSVGYETGFESPSEKSWQDVIRGRINYDREPSRFTLNW